MTEQTQQEENYEQARKELLAKIEENDHYREDLRVGIWGGATLSVALTYGVHLVKKYIFKDETDSSWLQYFIPQMTFTVATMYNILIDRKVRQKKYNRQLSNLEKTLQSATPTKTNSKNRLIFCNFIPKKLMIVLIIFS